MKEKKKSLYEQYSEVKSEHMDAIVFLQLGGFYQTYYNDAVIAADVCGVNLTCRPLGERKVCVSCGFPVISVDDKAGRLVFKGYRVVICNEHIDSETEMKSRTIARIHDVQKGPKVEIATECKEHLDKYLGYTDEELRKEFNIAPKAPKSPKKKEVMEENDVVRTTSEVKDELELIGFSSKGYEDNVEAILKKAKIYEDRARYVKSIALIEELDNLDTLHISPYRALKLIYHWQGKYGMNKQMNLPWDEV